jgi:hypothetical protein
MDRVLAGLGIADKKGMGSEGKKPGEH